MARPSWKEYWMGIAQATATRSTCLRANVGCVLVRDNRQVAAGYNGAISGQQHCDQAGCLMIDGHCVRSEHAERSMLADAARRGVSSLGCELFCTHSPCWPCLRMLAASGVKKIIFSEWKANGLSADLSTLYKNSGVEIVSKDAQTLDDFLKF